MAQLACSALSSACWWLHAAGCMLANARDTPCLQRTRAASSLVLAPWHVAQHGPIPQCKCKVCMAQLACSALSSVCSRLHAAGCMQWRLSVSQDIPCLQRTRATGSLVLALGCNLLAACGGGWLVLETRLVCRGHEPQAAWCWLCGTAGMQCTHSRVLVAACSWLHVGQCMKHTLFAEDTSHMQPGAGSVAQLACSAHTTECSWLHAAGCMLPRARDTPCLQRTRATGGLVLALRHSWHAVHTLQSARGCMQLAACWPILETHLVCRGHEPQAAWCWLCGT